MISSPHRSDQDAAAAIAQAALLLEHARQALGQQPTCAWWVPGRVEILGKHTDYSGGHVLNCAIDLGLVVAAAPRGDALVTVTSAGRRITLPLASTAQASEDWAVYPASVVRRLASHFPGLSIGADISISANLPPASGMSSSSALTIGVHHCLAHLNQLSERPEWQRAITSQTDLITYLGCHENGAAFRHLPGSSGVGTSGGSQDHAAIMLGTPGQLTDWSFAPVHHHGSVPWPAELRLAVVSSGVVAEKTGNAQKRYNRAAERAHAALAAWNRASTAQAPHLGAAIGHAGIAALLAAMPDDSLRRRAEQFAVESTVILPAALQALAQNDLVAFGDLVDRSQRLACTHLENQVPETMLLADLARDHGASAASAFGAGFGGSVWAAFPAEGDHADAWFAAYRARCPGPGALASLHRVVPSIGCTALLG